MAATVEPSRRDKRLPGQDDLPCEDGETLETWFHVSQADALFDSLWVAWADRYDFFVGGNMFVYFSEHQVRNNDFRGPDLFVVLDTERRPRKSWVAWEEGGKLPNFVLEITSSSTEHVDRGEKMRIYSKIWRTPAYFLLEPDSMKLEGYRLDADRLVYVPALPGPNGDLAVPALGLSLGVRMTRFRDFEQPFLRWLDAAGNALPTGEDLARAARAELQAAGAQAQAAEAQAHAAEAQAHAAEARVRELEQELAALRQRGG